MSYSLQIIMPDDFRVIKDPSPEEIDEAVDKLLPVEPNFIILNSDDPIDCCEFVQTAIAWEDSDSDVPELNYLIEVHFTDGEPYRQYAKLFHDPEPIKRILRMFALGVVPKIDEGWKDIVQDILNEAKDKNDNDTV